MQEAEEQDTCRICSAPAEDGQPLFHPCKCSGTIRYIHQDCLTTWLAHSKKKSCDVCKHPYSFTKVYAADMPSNLPKSLLIRRLVAHVFYALLLGLRAVAVGTIWLAVLPLMTVWSWRMYFSMGDSTAWWINDRPQPTPDRPPFFYQTAAANATTTTGFVFTQFTTHPSWLHLSSDIFAGQIIASIIVLTFVAIFLLREWISQNARPGVFDDDLPDEPLQEGQPAQVLVPVQGGAVPPRDPFADVQPVPPHLMILERQLREQRLAALRALDELRTVERANGHLVGRGGRGRRIRTRSTRDALQEGEEEEVVALAQRIADAVDEDANPGEQARRNRQRIEEDQLHRALEENERRRRKYVRRLHNARVENARRRLGLDDGDNEGQGNMDNFEFTFKAPGRVREPGSNPIPKPDAAAFNALFPPPGIHPASPDIPALPFSFASTSATPLRNGPSPSTPTTFVPRRPPLPTVTLPAIDFSEQPLSTTSSLSRGRTPLVSPGLATYRAPEDFDASPGLARGYFGDDAVGSDDGGAITEPDRDAEVEGPPTNAVEGDTDAIVEPPVEIGAGSGGDVQKGKQREDNEDSDVDTLPDSDAEDFDVYFKEDDAPEKGSIASPSAAPPSSTSRSTAEQTAKIPNEGSSSSDATPEAPYRGSDTEDDEAVQEGAEREDAEDIGDPSQDEEDEDGDAEIGNDIRPEPRLAFPGVENPNLVVRVGRPPEADPAAVALAARQQPPVLEVVNADNEFAEGNVEDDMEGALEAIGMRGPIYGVVQNAALMVFVLDAAIGVGVWIPFTIGKSTALLTLDPHRFLQILHLPIKAIRVLTDPVVDSLVYLIADIIFPKLLHLVKVYASLALKALLWVIKYTLGPSVSEKVQEHGVALKSYIHGKLPVSPSVEQTTVKTSWFSSVRLPWQDSPSPSLVEPDAKPIFPEILGPMQPFFTALGGEVRVAAAQLQETWKRMALGQGPAERAFAVILGYIVVALILAIYLNFLTVGNVKNASRAVRSAVRQQLLVLKVAAFIFIELVTFPLGCGIVLDLCTVWLFPEASLFSRAIYFFQAPLTAMFYHWVAGTMFMYSFAILLSGCRTIMRPGAMWFIKDPQDQNSHPIRDILDRPTMTQLRKICVSGLMYSFVVVCVVSSVAGLLLLGSKSIMPFRWKNREPLSSVPVDLIFLHIVLPYTMHYLRPRKGLKRVATLVWAFIARRLRLTSYFFGRRVPAEEYTPKSWVTNLIRPGTPAENLMSVWDGQLRRVPATDHIALPRDMRATAQVNAAGDPIDGPALELIALQNAEAIKAKRNPKEDYTVVYLPPHFRFRVITFIAILWVVGAVVLGVTVALPIQLGRSFFHLFIPYDVHDGYSLIIGFYLLWACYLVGRSIDRLDKRRQRRGGDAPRGDLRFFVLKRGLLWLAQISYMVFWLGVVAPTLVSITMDLYVVFPIRVAINPTLVPRIRIVDSWALGLLYGKMAILMYGIRAQTPIGRGLLRIKNNGWTHPDPASATKEVIGPIIGGLLGMILAPAICVAACHRYVPFFASKEKIAFINMYPGIFLLSAVAESASFLLTFLSSWSQAVRDKEFLVEMRLRNHDPEEDKKSGRGSETKDVVDRIPAN
ncbi:hypothetical protein HGRIS_004073 [Hohenbuehelia grisea]|uniref:RING-type E3 ubiquitin transferase n=1 Tax=Hohenbuehelia grisea TaxID=104357 RepID=A0ABR3JJ42_9AGAR